MAVLDDERQALGFTAPVDFAGNLDLGVPDPLADDVVAVLREALSNVARHARASSVVVGVILSGPRLEVTVSDEAWASPTRAGRAA